MKDNKAEESLRELLKGDPDLKAAFKETIEEMQRPENIEKAANSISGLMAAVQRKIKELKEDGDKWQKV
ncbi:MAG: hypothetical protein HFG52_08890 [Lachnospiraceae bacterium]|nr:hypothetical protein [Lachnospiraceae bacterium]